MDTAVGGEAETNWESSNDLCTLSRVKQVISGNLLYSMGSSARCSVVTQRGGREVPEGGDICTHIADSLGQQKLMQHRKAIICQ